jgi:hemoglobin
MTTTVPNESAAPTALELVGGEGRVRALVDGFYDLMDLQAEFAGLRARHLGFAIGTLERDQWLRCMA